MQARGSPGPHDGRGQGACCEQLVKIKGLWRRVPLMAPVSQTHSWVSPLRHRRLVPLVEVMQLIGAVVVGTGRGTGVGRGDRLGKGLGESICEAVSKICASGKDWNIVRLWGVVWQIGRAHV